MLGQGLIVYGALLHSVGCRDHLASADAEFNVAISVVVPTCCIEEHQRARWRGACAGSAVGEVVPDVLPGLLQS
jgi:hypothetical protein